MEDRIYAGAKQLDRSGQEIRIEGLSKRYGDSVVVDKLNLTVPKGKLLTLLGPSGCGKTTVLRSIAGFSSPDAGSIHVGGSDLLSLPPERRGTSMLFQNYALFPHMNVSENVAFGLKMHRVARNERSARVSASLARAKLEALADRYPSELSGGQQQRVALARALVIEPRVLLLDEPFGALDKNLREHMQTELRKLQQSLGITAIVVTHDQAEAVAISDLIAVMNLGRIEQIGSPEAIYDKPETRFVAEFTGVENILPISRQQHEDGRSSFMVADMKLDLPGDRHYGPTCVAIRAESVELFACADGQGLKSASECGGTIQFNSMAGAFASYEIALADGSTVVAREARRGQPLRGVGTRVGVRFPAYALSLVADERATNGNRA